MVMVVLRDLYNFPGRHPMHLLLTTAGGGELWVGSIYAAGDVECLRKNGINALVACASNSPVARASHLKHLGTYDGTGIAKGDVKWFQVISVLDAIGAELRAGGRVLLSCRNGAHRSALVAALALCFLTGESPDTVMDHIKTVREMCDFNSVHPGDRNQVRDFHRPLLTPARFLRSKASDLEAAHEALEPGEKFRLNMVMSPAEFQSFAAISGVSFPDWGLKV